MAKRKISATEKKLRAELRADQNRLKKLENQVAQNWKFGTEGAGKNALIINARIEEKKKKLARFGYKGAKQINWKKRAENSLIEEEFKFGKAWDKKHAENEVFKVIRPNQINGKSLKTNLSGALNEFNNTYLNMTSKNNLVGKLTIGGNLILYVSNLKEDEKPKEEKNNDKDL